ncbi:unnamed protein product [Cylindrotheca closterium]|uniref:VWFD domain-containing protein n=1 Tax=Cylindrotheca closterium TaxID=2856 RepID=A0AAD2PX05_9STRA|nr:unnamed protein product [Cylindrotheca closterium]
MKFSVAFLFTLLVGGTCAQNNGSTATGQSDLLEKRAVFQKEADEDAYAAFDSSEANNSDRQRKKVYYQQSALQQTLDENVTKQRRRAKKSKSSKKSSSKSSQVFFYAPVGAAPVRPVSQPVAAPVRVPYVVPIRAPDSPRITSPVAVNIGTTRGIPGGSSSSSSFKGFAYRAQFASVAPVAGPTGSTGSIYVEATAEDCQSINNGGLVEGQKFMGSSTFTFGFNLAMPEGSTNIETIAATARAALQALVVQRVINCSGFRRHLQKRAKRHHRRNKEQRRLNNGLPSGIVGNAQIGDVECTLSADGTSADCTTSVDIALKGPAEEALIKAEIIAALDEGDILSDTELGTIAEGFTHTEVTHVETTEPQIGGDPHIVTWKGEHYEYHGQCDMVMVNDPLFADNAGLDIHIRTKLVRFWSYIKNVSIRIGSDILEIVGNPDIKSREPMYWVNYEYMGDLDTIGGFPITYVATSGSKSVYEIDLSSKYPNAKIIIKIYKEFLRIKMEGKEEVWGNTVGLLGDYHTGETIGRDGVSVFDDYYKFGSEWQVNPTDPKLFQTLETPQYPEKCMLPDNPSGDRRRRLDEESVSMEEAEKACSTLKDPKQVKDCVYDILATQDLDMVGAF